MRTVILIAHSTRHRQLVNLVKKHVAVLEEFRLISTTEAGEVLEEQTGLEVTHLFPARKGGDIQLCGLVCTNSISLVVFLDDPLATDPAEPDIRQFLRACDLNNVPLATNVVSGHALIAWLGRHYGEESEIEREAVEYDDANSDEDAREVLQ